MHFSYKNEYFSVKLFQNPLCRWKNKNKKKIDKKNCMKFQHGRSDFKRLFQKCAEVKHVKSTLFPYLNCYFQFLFSHYVIVIVGVEFAFGFEIILSIFRCCFLIRLFVYLFRMVKDCQLFLFSLVRFYICLIKNLTVEKRKTEICIRACYDEIERVRLRTRLA